MFSINEQITESNNEPESSFYLLNEIKTIDNALIQLTLYLNTHSNDESAIKEHFHWAQKRHVVCAMLANQANQRHMPQESNQSYTAISDITAWPWQIQEESLY